MFQFTLTSSPLMMSQVALASFVPNIRQPHQDQKKPYKVKTADYSVQPDEIFDLSTTASSKSRFKILGGKLASIMGERGRDSAWHMISTVKGNIYSLNNPDNLFKEIVSWEKIGEAETGEEETGEKDIKSWLQESRKTDPHFVVGFRTFFDAGFSRDEHMNTDISTAAKVPFSAAQGDPSGAANFSIEAGHNMETNVKEGRRALGERIYAICYRRIRTRHWFKGSGINLCPTNHWQPVGLCNIASWRDDGRYGRGYDGIYGGGYSTCTPGVGFDLEDNDQKNCEVYEVETKDGKPLLFYDLPRLGAEESDDKEESDVKGESVEKGDACDEQHSGHEVEGAEQEG